jgi:hypothetical protein
MVKLVTSISPIVNAGRGEPRNVHRDLHAVAGLGQHRQAGNVIAVLVRDQDRRQGLGRNADPLQTLESIFAAEARINQETGLLGRQQCGVPCTGRRKYPAFYDKCFSPKIA